LVPTVVVVVSPGYVVVVSPGYVVVVSPGYVVVVETGTVVVVVVGGTGPGAHEPDACAGAEERARTVAEERTVGAR
jgi:hypothetical protein